MDATHNGANEPKIICYHTIYEREESVGLIYIESIQSPVLVHILNEPQQSPTGRGAYLCSLCLPRTS